MINKQKIIIDTDCGSDDAVAIAMALNDPRYDVLFFSTVSGNVDVVQAADNALTAIEYAGSYEPPVYIGCGEMLLHELALSHVVHGEDGMGDIGYRPQRLHVKEGNGVLKIIEALEQHTQGEIEIITLGPLTNIALAMRLAPQTMRRVKRIVAMAGAGLGTGNVTPVAEFNVWQDTEAAKIVVDFGIPLVFVGWDACLGDAVFCCEEIERIRSSGSLGKFAVDCNRQLMELNEERFGRRCLDMADPAAVAAALFPECVEECEKYYCEVDTTPGPGYGSVIVDKYHFSDKEPNVEICSKLHTDIYKEYVFRTLRA